MLFCTHLLLLLQPSVLWLSIVTFNNDAKPPPKSILREFDVSWIQPRLGGLPYLKTFTWQNLTPCWECTLFGRPGYLPWRVTPPITMSCKRDQIKMRDYMDRWVTQPKRVTSLTRTRGPPPPWKVKQALKVHTNTITQPERLLYKRTLHCRSINNFLIRFSPNFSSERISQVWIENTAKKLDG